MRKDLAVLLSHGTSMPVEIASANANCFNAVQLYWQDVNKPAFTGSTEFVGYLFENFDQLSQDEPRLVGDVTVVWSRSSFELPLGAVSIAALQRRDRGYPFGLVIEHAFVQHDDALVFQKRDPSKSGSYELLSRKEALAPYLGAQGYELTHHRRKVSI